MHSRIPAPGRAPGKGMWIGVACCLLGFALAEAKLFYPSEAIRRTPADLGVAYRDVELPLDANKRLHGWFLPAADPVATVVFFHGNAGNVGTHIEQVAWLPQRGFNVLTMDYSGFGRSDGYPDVNTVYRDCTAIMAYAEATAGGLPLIVYGQSMGGAMAAATIGLNDYPAVCGVVVEGAFSSYKRIVSDKVGGLGSLFVSDRLKPEAHIGAIRQPVLVVHGLKDKVVPPYHARHLYEAASEPKELWLIPDAGHLDIIGRERSVERSPLAAMLADWAAAAEPVAERR